LAQLKAQAESEAAKAEKN